MNIKLLCLLIAGTLYFSATGAMIPLLPLVVINDLGSTATMAGIALASLNITSALLRSIIGQLVDQYGCRIFLVGGAALFGLLTFALIFTHSVTGLIWLRLLAGIGDSAILVAGAVASQALSDESYQAKAASFFSGTLYAGFMIGGFMSVGLYSRTDLALIWFLIGLFALLSSGLFICTKTSHKTPSTSAIQTRTKMVSKEVIMPGLILGAGIFGLTCFFTYLPLQAAHSGVTHSVGIYISLCAILVIIFRFVFGELPEKMGLWATMALSLLLTALGTAVIGLANLQHAYVLFFSVFLLAPGIAYLMPSTLLRVAWTSLQFESGFRIGSLILFMDFALISSGIILGIIVDKFNPSVGFVVCSVISILAIPIVIFDKTHAPSLLIRTSN